MHGEKSSIMSESEAVVTLSEVFEGFKHHFDGHRISTELTMLELLRKIHPEFHVTCTLPSEFDLFGYAAAGHASVKLFSDEATMDATRTYKLAAKGPLSQANTSVSRLSAAEGELSNHVRFGRWRYHWESNEYILYEIEYPESTRGSKVKLYFVLSPRSEYSPKEGASSPTDQLLLVVGSWCTRLHDEIYVFDDGHWSKSKELCKSVQDSSWNDVILDPAMKENLLNDVQGFFENEQLYKSLAVPWKRGVILHGIPGNGKTISIKAIINTLNTRSDSIPALYVKSFDACQGEKRSIRSIFQHARKKAPCLLIFEDLDSLVTNKTRSYFLNEVDGLESNDGILMIGSTNHLSSLDPAISKRPSRFDRKYHFNIPRLAERAAYCKFWQQKLAGSEMVDFQDGCREVIAQMTEGFSFAYLKELFVVVLLVIARGGTGEEVEEEGEKEESLSAVSDSRSDDGHVVVEHADANTQSGDSGEQKEGKVEKPAPSLKVKRIIPNNIIPETLQNNVLLRVVKGQIKMLLDEMDNTDQSEWVSEKKWGGGVPSGKQFPVLGGRRAC